MPVASLPDVLRRRLSLVEQNVLLLATRGGARMVASELGARESGGVRSVEDAELLIEQTRAKAGRILAESRNGNGGALMASCAQHGEFTDRGRGCPACDVAQGGGERPKPAGGVAKDREPKASLAPAAPRRARRQAREEQQRRTAEGEREALRRKALEAAGVVEDEDSRATPVSSGEDGTLQRVEAGGERDTPVDGEPPSAPSPASTDSFEPPPAVPADAAADPLSPVAAPARDRARQRSKAEIARDRERLLALLADGPRSQYALALEMGVTASQVQNDLRHMATDGAVAKTGRYVFDWPREGSAGRASTQWEIKAGSEAEAKVSVSGEPPAAAVEQAEAAPAPTNDGPGEAAAVDERPDPRKVALLGRLRRRREAAEREQAALAGELRELADEMMESLDAEVPQALLRGRYLAALLRRIEQGDTSAELLDRFERLAGFED